MKVHIITVAVNSFFLDRYFAGLKAQSHETGIILVRSSNFNLDKVPSVRHELRRMQNVHIVGPVKEISPGEYGTQLEGLNLGLETRRQFIKRLEPGWTEDTPILFLGQDVQVYPDTIDKLLQVLIEKPDVGIVGCAEQIFDLAYGGLHTHNPICEFTSDRGFTWLPADPFASSYTDAVCFTCMLMRPEILQSFEENGGEGININFLGMEMGMEDIMIALRAREMGYKIYTTVDTKIYHVKQCAEHILYADGGVRWERDTDRISSAIKQALSQEAKEDSVEMENLKMDTTKKTGDVLLYIPAVSPWHLELTFRAIDRDRDCIQHIRKLVIGCAREFVLPEFVEYYIPILRDLGIEPKFFVVDHFYNTSGQPVRSVADVDTSEDVKTADVLGTGTVRNAAFKFISEDPGIKYVMYLDQAIELLPGCIQHMREVLEGDSDVHFVGPQNLSFEGKQEDDRYVLEGISVELYIENNEIRARRLESSQYVRGLVSFCLMCRAKSLMTLGGWKEDFYQCEDIDLSMKANRVGMKMYYCHEAKVYRVGQAGLSAPGNEERYTTQRISAARKYVVDTYGLDAPYIEDTNIVALPIRDKLRIHVLGLAHTKANRNYSYCAFTTLTRFFCKAMKKLGHEIVFYGTEGSDLDCTEMVTCLSEQDFQRTYGQNDNHQYQYLYQVGDDPKHASRIFEKNCQRELKRRLPRNGAKEIAVVAFGDRHNYLKSPEFRHRAVPIDAHVGHAGAISEHRVFPSKVWRHFVYGLEDALRKQAEQRGEQVQYPPLYWMDAVIYHYLDLDEYPFQEKKGDYAVFIGRMNFDKGYQEAVVACKQLGIPIKIAGPLYQEGGKASIQDFIRNNAEVAEYVGTVDVDNRAELVGNAKVLFCPSYYSEPFGMVAIEAMALGTPVIATNWGGFCETVLHGKTGFQIAYFQDFITALRNIDKINPADCRRWVEANFTIDIAGPLYEKYFRRVLQEAHTRNPNCWYETSIEKPGSLFQSLHDPFTEVQHEESDTHSNACGLIRS